MENKKEPLMSALEFYKSLDKNYTITELMQMYANYVTKWHLNNAKEFVADEAKLLSYTSYHGCIDFARQSVDKKSIHTAIDNYIEINLNKEL